MNQDHTMNYVEAMMVLAKHHLTPGGFDLFLKVDKNMPNIWNRPSSSTMKYHKKADGSVPSIAHHTYEMFYAACKIIRMFGGKAVSVDNDAILLAVIFHDMQKYGPKGNMPHTNNYHDRSMADLLEKNRGLFKSHFNEKQMDTLILGVRFHSGQWSKSVTDMKSFNFEHLNPVIIFVHMLDMLSTSDCLQFPHVNMEGR